MEIHNFAMGTAALATATWVWTLPETRRRDLARIGLRRNF
jgi:hypothetical protein